MNKKNHKESEIVTVPPQPCATTHSVTFDSPRHPSPLGPCARGESYFKLERIVFDGWWGDAGFIADRDTNGLQSISILSGRVGFFYPLGFNKPVIDSQLLSGLPCVESVWFQKKIGMERKCTCCVFKWPLPATPLWKRKLRPESSLEAVRSILKRKKWDFNRELWNMKKI